MASISVVVYHHNNNQSQSLGGEQHAASFGDCTLYLRNNWRNEFSFWMPTWSTAVIMKTKTEIPREAKVLIISYDLAVRKIEALRWVVHSPPSEFYFQLPRAKVHQRKPSTLLITCERTRRLAPSSRDASEEEEEEQGQTEDH